MRTLSSEWPKEPFIYEINTWVWLQELSRHHRQPLTLENVPRGEWDALGSLGIDAVWLMGVWERSPAGIRIARETPALQSAYRDALPDYTVQDVVGSPYCVHRYVVDEHLGGPKGLARARNMLAQRGIRLILDFVPNHVARDHPWVTEHPEYFVQGGEEDHRRDPDAFFEAGGKVLACGRDPYFPAWTDTAQLNAFHPGLRQGAIETLSGISNQCDGVRCDMAMLLLNGVFEKTWSHQVGQAPESEYWKDTIEAIRTRNPGFLFVGEAYWGLESELQELGFDYCYDKLLYDRLAGGDAQNVRLHLLADVSYQAKLLRFIENHDEPRAAQVFPRERARAAPLIAFALPGAKLIHEGQIEGRRVKLPVQLGRRPEERIDPEIQAFYTRLLEVLRTAQIQGAQYRLCELSGWPDNSSWRNLVAWCRRQGPRRCVVVVNFSRERSQARVRVPFADLAGTTYRLEDRFSGESYQRDGDEMLDPGLYVDLSPWGFHFLRFA